MRYRVRAANTKFLYRGPCHCITYVILFLSKLLICTYSHGLGQRKLCKAQRIYLTELPFVYYAFCLVHQHLHDSSPLLGSLLDNDNACNALQCCTREMMAASAFQICATVCALPSPAPLASLRLLRQLA
ncbi:hypothetical protein TRVL_08605 [Trypanosoma vivax]|nr:hypothetical protein TRVL_08605 [Trypanosoma vivax]